MFLLLLGITFSLYYPQTCKSNSMRSQHLNLDPVNGYKRSTLCILFVTTQVVRFTVHGSGLATLRSPYFFLDSWPARSCLNFHLFLQLYSKHPNNLFFPYISGLAWQAGEPINSSGYAQYVTPQYPKTVRFSSVNLEPWTLQPWTWVDTNNV